MTSQQILNVIGDYESPEELQEFLDNSNINWDSDSDNWGNGQELVRIICNNDRVIIAVYDDIGTLLNTWTMS